MLLELCFKSFFDRLRYKCEYMYCNTATRALLKARNKRKERKKRRFDKVIIIIIFLRFIIEVFHFEQHRRCKRRTNVYI